MTDGAESGHPGIAVAGWGPTPTWSIYAVLFLASTALLTLEVSLTRLFSFTIWYHMAYLTISVALLGFGSSGALVSAFPRIFRDRGHNLIVGALVTAALATVGALVFFARIPLEITTLQAVLRKGEIPTKFLMLLFGYYLAVGAPFFLAGLAIGVPFAAYPRLMGRLYFFDLLGAATGCILVVVLVAAFSVPGLILAAAALMLVSAGVLSFGAGNTMLGSALTGAALLGLVLSPSVGKDMRVDPTSGKGLGNFREAIQRDDAYTRWTALNRVDAFGWKDANQIAYWLGAGIKRNYHGPHPRVARIVYDGSNGSNIYPFDGSFESYAFLDNHILKTPYLIRNEPDVLVIGVGGGIDMLTAIRQGARHVTGVELQPETVYLLQHRLRDFTGGFYDRPDVTLIASEGRHFIRKTDRVFDMLQITGVDTFAAQATGAYILAESYLYTVEAQEDYFAHLTDDGLLSMIVGDIRSRDSLPPLVTRLALNSYRALQRMGIDRPQDHIVVISAIAANGWAQSANVLVKRQPFTSNELQILHRHTTANGFGMLWAPKLMAPAKFMLGDILGSDELARQRAIDNEWFRVDAVYDNDPFFYNVGKWSNFSPNGKMTHYALPGSFIGQLVLVLMLVQSLILGLVLIGVPLLRGAREGLQLRGVVSYLAYFLALGVGFMFIEISFIQSFVLFLGSPTYALSVTIFALLLFSSLGSFLSTRFVDRPEWALRRLMPLIATLVLLYVAGLSTLFETFLGLPIWARILIAVAAQVPMGLTLGMFMPLGIASVSRRHSRLVPWAWGINGLGSVLGTTLSVILAMSLGFKTVAVGAVMLYLIGTALLVSSEHSATRNSTP